MRLKYVLAQWDESHIVNYCYHELACLKSWSESCISTNWSSLTREIYVIPPLECSDKKTYWLLITAAYELVKANSKWQYQYYLLFTQPGLTQCPVIPQLSYIYKSGRIILSAAKIVDEILFTGESDGVGTCLTGFKEIFKFGTAVHGPGNLRFYGMIILQNDDYFCNINFDDKLSALEPYPITRLRRLEFKLIIAEIEKSAFMSLTSSFGWLGIAASPFCAF